MVSNHFNQYNFYNHYTLKNPYPGARMSGAVCAGASAIILMEMFCLSR
jgi:hypothetical protein